MKIEVKNLRFSYTGSRKLIENASFVLESSSFSVLLGKNGAGKSTLFRLLLDILRPGGGEILVDGRSVSELSAREKAEVFSYIPQSSHIEFSYTVLETVLMASASKLGLFSSPSRRDVEEAEMILSRLKIHDLKNRRMENLSGGERQLVLIARALMQKAGFVILDEPTSNLDYGNQIMVLEMIKALSESGVGIIYSTHNPELALTYSSSILILDENTIKSYPSAESLAESNALEKLYGNRLFITKVDTGENMRYICVPK